MTRGTQSLTGIPMRWLRKQPRSREVRRQGAPRTERCSPHVQKTYVGRFSSMLDGVFKPILHKNFAEWPTGRPARENRFAYAESPAKQRHDRELPDTAHNPNELGRIRILLPVVSFWSFWPAISEPGWTRRKQVSLRAMLASTRPSYIRIWRKLDPPEAR